MIDADGSNVRRLTNHQGGVEAPQWSPDGTSIAYGYRGEIYRVNTDGSEASLLISGKKGKLYGGTQSWDASHFAWSPLGTQALFVFTDKHGKPMLGIADVNRPGHAEIATIHDNASAPTWSPDGQRYAFQGNDEHGESRIFLEDVKSYDAPKRLSSVVVEARNPTWSPNGLWIAYTAGSGEIYAVESAWAHERKVTAQRAQDDWLSWSADGTQLAFASADQGSSEICVINADGSHFRQLTHLRQASHPVWSPDGTRIVLVSDRAIHLMHADGSDVKRLTDEGMWCAHPAWSADGKRIAYVGMPASRRDLNFRRENGGE
ncbi:MAG: PD40 domain-containing protein [Candidatus Omnitrophica bacterium]|nr:PD40 domain-containing protein [Candidatus Omnitrophota bacterium]